MRKLSDDEILAITGADIQLEQAIAMAAGAFAGSYIFGQVSSNAGPLSTVITTVGGTLGCGFVGSLVMPVVGTIVGGATCGVGSYYMGSATVTALSYLVGGAVGAGGMYYTFS